MQEKKSNARLQIIVALIAAASAIVVALISASRFGADSSSNGTEAAILQGRVLDSQSLKGINGAKLTLDSPSGASTSYSDAEGAFSFSAVLPSSLRGAKLRVEAEGYQVYDRELPSTAGNRVEEVRLSPMSVETRSDKPVAKVGLKVHPRESPDGEGPLPDSIQEFLGCDDDCYYNTTDAIVYDLNGDGLKEILLCHGGGSCGSAYYIFSLTEEGKWTEIGGGACGDDTCRFEIQKTERLGYRDVDAGGFMLRFNGAVYSLDER